jgi:MFS family permease
VNPARKALALLLSINLLSYIDRYILAAILGMIQIEFLAGDPEADAKAGLLATAFFVSYMLTAPIFGWLADRYSRWVIIGCGVLVWSLASGASGLATSFAVLLATRAFLGIGEAAYGPAAPTIISDMYPVEKRGQVMSWFYMAIPLGSALGYVIGGMVAPHFGWRMAFYLMTPPGVILALLAFFMKDPRAKAAASLTAEGKLAVVRPKPKLSDYAMLLRISSLRSNILAQTAFTFALGGLAMWAPKFIHEARGVKLELASTIFGAILAVTGLFSTLFGGWLADKLRNRYPGAYFLVSGAGMLVGFPATIGILYVPFPYAWGCVFVAMFFLFLNTGPSNTAIANVTPPHLRATAFAMNILIIHALGDVISPPLIGWIKGHYGWEASFITVSLVMLVAGLIWLLNMKPLAKDTAAQEEAGEMP